MAGTVLGRWTRIDDGRLVRIEPLLENRCKGAWKGDKSGMAGFFGFIANKGRYARGEWFDDSAGIQDKHRCVIEVNLGSDNKSITVKCFSRKGANGEAPSVTEWEAKREQVPRENGRISKPEYISKETFDKLTAEHWQTHENWAESQRQSILNQSMTETKTQPRRLDGSTSYIPPISICDPYFDTDKILRKHGAMGRHSGRQIHTGPTVSFRVGSDLPEHMPEPYEDWGMLVRRLRREARKKREAKVPAKLAERPAFRGTAPTVAVARDYSLASELYLSKIDKDTAEKDLSSLAAAARAPLLSPEAQAAFASGKLAPPKSLPRALVRHPETGRMDIQVDSKNFLVGYPHWLVQYEKPLEYMSEGKEEAKKAARAAYLAEMAKMQGRPSFKGVGPSINITRPDTPPEEIERRKTLKEALENDAKKRRHGGDEEEDGEGKKKEEERPPFKSTMRDHAKTDFGIGPYPEFVHNPPDKPGSPSRAERDEAAKKDKDAPMWRDVSSPAIPSRYVQSVALHPKLVRTDYLPAAETARAAGRMPLASPLRPVTSM